MIYQKKEAKKKLKELENRVLLLDERIELIEFVEEKDMLNVETNYHDEREIIISQNKDISGKNLYLELKKLHKQFEVYLDSNNQNIFGTILTPSEDNFSHQVFYCVNSKKSSRLSSILPAGYYISIYYSGDYKNRNYAYSKLNHHIKCNDLIISGPYREFYLLDFHETNYASEYVTKIEVKLSSKNDFEVINKKLMIDDYLH